MKKTTTATNTELDQLTQDTDAARGQMVLRKVYDFLGRFVAYPSEHARVAHALWVLHTHLMDRWDSTPRLAFLSAEPASGKSRALEITELLVRNPVMGVNLTASYIFRKVGVEEGATLLYDEFDTVFGEQAKGNEEIRALLNAGHRRGAVVGRCVVHGKTVTTEEISAYAAVALAGMGWLPDTIRTRAVIVRMRRRKSDEQIDSFRHRVAAPEGERIRQELELWSRTVPPELAWPTMPPEIQDRDADVWEALITVADLAGGDWPDRARQAAIASIDAAKETEPSYGIQLLTDLRAVFGDADKLATETILKALHERDESPWRDIKGKPLDGRGLARRLREYGIKSRTVRIGNATPRGYERADFHDAWARYLPSPTSATSATSATPATETPVTRLKTAKNERGVSPVAHVVHFPGREGGNHCPAIGTKCALCGKTGATLQVHTAKTGEGVWLHRECEQEWIKLEVPDFLRQWPK